MGDTEAYFSQYIRSTRGPEAADNFNVSMMMSRLRYALVAQRHRLGLTEKAVAERMWLIAQAGHKRRWRRVGLRRPTAKQIRAVENRGADMPLRWYLLMARALGVDLDRPWLGVVEAVYSPPELA
ncbi:MAG TPA: hypothetical protein VLF67_02300 [Candidatus Saccharimonas sp.]|nr:hypothetical protein [Candidatus Saccharimonas sp.]